MKKVDLAASMESVLESAEHKDMFASAEQLQKLAFKKEAQTMANAPSPDAGHKVEQAYKCVGCADYYVKDKAGPCQCKPGAIQECAQGCGCHNYPAKTGFEFWKTQSSDAADELIVIASDSLLRASEELEEAGLEELSAKSLNLLNEIIVEAKKRKAKKSKKSPAKSTEKSKKSDKAEKDSEKDSEKKST